MPLFVLDPYFFAPLRAQELPHRMQFLLESLEALAANIAKLGSRLVVVSGKSTEQIPELVLPPPSDGSAGQAARITTTTGEARRDRKSVV